MKIKFSISMDGELLKEIDSLAKTEGRTRSNMIERLLWQILNQPTIIVPTDGKVDDGQ